MVPPPEDEHPFPGTLLVFLQKLQPSWCPAGVRRAAKQETVPPPEDEEGVVDLLDSDEEEGAGEQDPAGPEEQAQASYSAEQSQVR